MKSHLKFFLLWLIWISATSCSQTYYTQVFTTQSPKLMKSSEGWFYETDSIKIVYDFFHAHGKMNFTIYNKQKSPIYIDWQNSSFTNNGFNNTYWNETKNEKD